ncbi:MAG: NPCBM/NEW2 domain-containing protein, partial [Planctomycetota bacterium]|nr:NPCBM/NEW2 domain-containing protein [Planctomycetota bacterium]
ALPGWRAGTQPRKYPVYRRIPEGAGKVLLSELFPSRIDTAKGPLRIDGSFNGGPLRLGRTVVERGLGQWIESDIRYELDGRFRRFTAMVAIDSEGREKISRARADAERTVFMVLADDRIVAQTRELIFSDGPQKIEADITGAGSITLRVRRATPQGWLYGPVAWGEPTVHR